MTYNSWTEIHRLVRTGQHLITSFLLICACKICFKDETTATILFEMMKKRGIYDRVPVLPWQVAQVINAVSGYSANLDGVLPSTVLVEVLEQARRKLTPRDGIEDAVKLCSTDRIAQIICDVFTALQDTEIRYVVIRGMKTAAWLTTFFLWLCPDVTDYLVKGEAVLQNPRAKVLIYWTNQPWEIQLWRPEAQPAKVLVRHKDLGHQPLEQPFHEYYPVKAAKSIIASMIHPNGPEVIDSIGQLAGALVDLAVESGKLRSDRCSHMNGTQQNYGGDKIKAVALIEICSEDFLAVYSTIMERFGWICDNQYHKGKQKIKEVLGRLSMEETTSWTTNTSTSSLDLLKSYVLQGYKIFYDNHKKRMLLINDDTLLAAVLEPAIHLAAESLLTSFRGSTKHDSFFRPPENARLTQGANILAKLLNQSHSGLLEFSGVRVEVMRASVQDAPEILPLDLAVASDGYVAYSTALETVDGCMTDKRLATEIRVIPGQIRVIGDKSSPSDIHGNEGHFAKLVEDSYENEVAGRVLGARPMAVEAFSEAGQYEGFQMEKCPNKARIEFLLTASYGRERRLLLKTSLRSETPRALELIAIPSSNFDNWIDRSPPVPVSWRDSIVAVAFARHVTEYTSSPEQMRQLARLWKDKGILGEDHLVWTPPGYAVLPPTEPGARRRRYVSMTAHREQLRFFEAGYLSGMRHLFIRRLPPLEQCLKEAFTEMENDDWAIIT